MKIYHNTHCSKSCKALDLLIQNNLAVDVIEYVSQTPTKEELIDLLKKLELKPLDIIRKKENIFIDNYQGKTLTDDQWIDVLIQHPTLMERPIIVKGDKAIVARPPERVLELI